jgi:uncharacterized protein (TIGR00730 family)
MSTHTDLQKGVRYGSLPRDSRSFDAKEAETTSIVTNEIHQTFETMRHVPKSVTFFGSARLKEGSSEYEHTRRLAHLITKKLGYAIISGGGGGIMEAANRGAFEAGGMSIGMNIILPKEQHINPYVHRYVTFEHFYTRKVALSLSAEAYIVFPGGFGTFDEMFEVITLMQTGKIPRVPLFLVGSSYWNALDVLIREKMIPLGLINPDDIHLYHITDNDEEIIDTIRNSPVHSGPPELKKLPA